MNEHALYHATLPFLEGYDEHRPGGSDRRRARSMSTITLAARRSASMGKSEDFAKRGLAGVVSVIPFKLHAGNCVTALSQFSAARHDNIPYLNLDYDGFVDSSRDSKIVSFMWQVKERHAGRQIAQDEILISRPICQW